MNTASIIRHFLTYLAGLGGVLLSWNLISADQVDTVNKAAGDMINPASVILGAVAAGLARLLLAWISKLFRSGAGEGNNGLFVGLVCIGTMAGVGGLLPSCSPAERAALKEVPLQACYIGEHGERICYSTKDGVLVEVNRRSAK